MGVAGELEQQRVHGGGQSICVRGTPACLSRNAMLSPSLLQTPARANPIPSQSARATSPRCAWGAQALGAPAYPWPGHVCPRNTRPAGRSREAVPVRILRHGSAGESNNHADVESAQEGERDAAMTHPATFEWRFHSREDVSRDHWQMPEDSARSSPDARCSPEGR